MTLASAAAVFWITRRTNLVAAVTQAEVRRLEAAPDGRVSGEPSWQDLAKERDAALVKRPESRPHFALQQLLSLIVDVHEGRRAVSDALALAEGAARRDPDNRVARLAYATLIDSQADSTADAMSALDRFERLRSIVQGNKPSSKSTLYNAEFTDTWHGILKRYIRRPDVAASLAASSYHYRIVAHYAALPIVQRRFGNLAEQLRAEGQADAAETCKRWVAEAMLGLIRADADAGTRLLCADLLARTLADDAAAVARLKAFRRDYHEQATKAGADLVEHWVSSGAAVAPGAYRTVMLLALACLTLTTLAAGAGVLCLIAAVLSLFARRRKQGIAEGASAGAKTWQRLLLIGIPAAVVTALVLRQFQLHSYFSVIWCLVLALCVMASGSFIVIALAGFTDASQDKSASQKSCGTGVSPVSTPPGRRCHKGFWTHSKQNRAGLIVSVIAALPAVVAVALSPQTVAWICRNLDLAIGAQWIILVSVLGLVIVSAWVSPARLPAIAAAGARVWCFCVLAALLICPFVAATDRQYQQAAVAGHKDEVAARLGADWQQRYLQPALDSFGGDRS